VADWGARLKSAWHGEVSDADLGAMFAATSGLDGLHQALEDRRLTAQIDNAGHDWRVVLAVGTIAAPLWLADALVALAGAFYDTETQSHPDRPTSVSADTHDLVATLLAPVEDIIADVTAALADPKHRAALTSPLRVGPGGDVAAYPQPDPIPILYARGLVTGARRVHTSAAVSLASAQQAVAKSPSPDWLAVGLRRLDGELQAAGARLDIAEVRLTPLLDARSSDHTALASICRDLWTVLDAAMVAGQLASDPHLLPDARIARPTDAAPSPAPPQVPAPAAQARRAHPFALPQIAEGSPSPQYTSQSALPPGGTASAPPPDMPLPVIDEGSAATPSAPALPSVRPPGNVSLPSVGEPSQPQNAAPQPPPKSTRDAPPSKATSGGQDDEPLVSFPDIG
jgi:hypothetical protein